MSNSYAKTVFIYLVLSIMLGAQAKAQMAVRKCEIKEVVRGASTSYLMGASELETYMSKRKSKLSVQVDSVTYALPATNYALSNSRQIEVAYNESQLLLRCGGKVHALTLSSYKSISVIGFKYLEDNPHCYFQLTTSNCRYYFSITFHSNDTISIVDYDTKPTLN